MAREKQQACSLRILCCIIYCFLLLDFSCHSTIIAYHKVPRAVWKTVCQEMMTWKSFILHNIMLLLFAIFCTENNNFHKQVRDIVLLANAKTNTSARTNIFSYAKRQPIHAILASMPWPFSESTATVSYCTYRITYFVLCSSLLWVWFPYEWLLFLVGVQIKKYLLFFPQNIIVVPTPKDIFKS